MSLIQAVFHGVSIFEGNNVLGISIIDLEIMSSSINIMILLN